MQGNPGTGYRKGDHSYRRREAPELGGYAGVYKYQASSQIVREVMACYGEEKSVLPVQSSALKKSTDILGVYSPLGRCLKTSFALTLGQILAKERPVLYLNLEEYAGFEELFGRSFSGTLSDLLYFVQQGENNLSVKLSGMVQTAGTLDFIPPVQSPLDIRGLHGRTGSVCCRRYPCTLPTRR